MAYFFIGGSQPATLVVAIQTKPASGRFGVRAGERKFV